MNHRLLPLLLTGTLVLAASLRADSPTPEHWSLRPRGRPAVPLAANADRSPARNPIDAFLLARLGREGLHLSPQADRRTLIRRLSFDLTGLPPTPQQVAAFVEDPAPDAYEKLVDRLLASPAYGERWGRHWLDVVRYAETEGFEYDRHRPGAWRYRDYVLDSFNRDKPYDRFVREQIAGDELAKEGDHELHVAAGFHRLGPVRRNAGNPELVFSRHEVLTEMTDVLGVVFLGLTAGCARCHDHPFDDFSLQDYYHLQAYLSATQERDLKLAGAQPPPWSTISTVQNVPAQRMPIHVLKRGNEQRKGKLVGPRWPRSLAGEGSGELPPDVADPRTHLAGRIASADNPLTARVLVNRLWQHHFGKGLVETANDFGVNGSAPSHPELLDWLANEFVAGGWRIKPVHRLIVLSSTYRQASQVSGSHPGVAKDPTNRLLWRFPRRRLSAEEVRDAMLLVSGRLNERMAGPSVMVPVEPDLVQLLYAPSQWAVTPDRGEHDRRSVYLIAKRNLRLPFLEAFDQPDAQTSCATRESSTHPLQALELLNGRLANELAKAFARRLRLEAGPERARVVECAFLWATGRLPTAKEKELAVRFLAQQSLEEFALAVLNLNAFLYVD